METERLILRRYEKRDLEDLYEYLSDPLVVKYEPYQPMTKKETEDNLNWRITTDEMIAVELKDNHKMIGNVYLGKREFDTLELGYVFHKDYWGHGYAKESCEALIRKAFEEGIHRIFAECDPKNAASWKLLESLGFEREAYFKKNVFFWKDENGQPIWKDTYVYSRLNVTPEISYQKLTEKELDTFIQMRIHQLREEGAKDKIDLAPALLDYYHRHMADGTFVSWIAKAGDEIIGTSGMSFVEKPPYFGCPSGKMGLLSSMYTNPAYRRRGIAKELLSRVVNEAREYGCGTVQITASDMGVLLYTDFGFEKNGNFMQYKL